MEPSSLNKDSKEGEQRSRSSVQQKSPKPKRRAGAIAPFLTVCNGRFEMLFSKITKIDAKMTLTY
jgi:hypothetical protein